MLGLEGEWRKVLRALRRDKEPRRAGLGCCQLGLELELDLGLELDL